MADTKDASSSSFMTPVEATKLSKLLAYVLRHGAAKEKLTLRSDGYLLLSDLLARPKFKNITQEQIEYVVRTNDKQRYALAQLEDGQWYIRANQGHTLKVDNEQLLERLTTPLPVVVHGTSQENWKNIKHQGLKKMQRHHVHCATGLPGDSGVISGMRKTSEVFIYIDMAKALQDGIPFYRSKNQVILTEGKNGVLSPEYFCRVTDSQGNSLL
ncbi:hypothetical protein LRAMOSA00271 [Lichtheimia ramosa]|uniref:2'-phosphotransferase n=1 Tax=Lichtheimia ramosa TaxID=688394 RepID=A0A077W9U1_9FUNG|nr:hypothetical protein LRAMOSA00271 [Lichtheimia ramosa]